MTISSLYWLTLSVLLRRRAGSDGRRRRQSIEKAPGKGCGTYINRHVLPQAPSPTITSLRRISAMVEVVGRVFWLNGRGLSWAEIGRWSGWEKGRCVNKRRTTVAAQIPGRLLVEIGLDLGEKDVVAEARRRKHGVMGGWRKKKASRVQLNLDWRQQAMLCVALGEGGKGPENWKSEHAAWQKAPWPANGASFGLGSRLLGGNQAVLTGDGWQPTLTGQQWPTERPCPEAEFEACKHFTVAASMAL